LIVPNLKDYSEKKLSGLLSSSNTNHQKREEALRVEQALLVRMMLWLHTDHGTVNVIAVFAERTVTCN
jgi:hypothetical protein